MHKRTQTTAHVKTEALCATSLTRGGCPTLQLACTPLAQVVHVLEELWPGHDAWCRIRGDKVWASALGVRADLFAHVLAESGQLVLKLHAVLEVLGEACLVCLHILRLEKGSLGACDHCADKCSTHHLCYFKWADWKGGECVFWARAS